MRTTQRQNVLRHLLAGPLCGVEDDWLLGRRIAARIYDLRSVGFAIETVPCDIGHQHRTRQSRYRLRPAQWRNGSINQWKDCCANCGPVGKVINTGVADKPQNGLWVFEVVCGECGKKDYR